MEKENTAFTATDYFSAAQQRYEDLKHLKKNQKSIIFSLYCAGVVVECLLRAYIRKNTTEFDSKHDLEKLYEKSQIATLLSIKEKEKMSVAIKTVNRQWNNNLRYTSTVRMKRLIARKLINSGYKDINKYINKYYADIFKAVDLIIKIGEEKWKL